MSDQTEGTSVLTPEEIIQAAYNKMAQDNAGATEHEQAMAAVMVY